MMVIIGAYVYLYCTCSPPAKTVFIPCLFFHLTGVPCPGCGMSRAIADLLQGRFHQALVLNVFSFPLALFSIIAIIWIVMDILRGYESLVPALKKPWKPIMVISALSLIFASWILKVYLHFSR
jgi:hypothetical protein